MDTTFVGTKSDDMTDSDNWIGGVLPTPGSRILILDGTASWPTEWSDWPPVPMLTVGRKSALLIVPESVHIAVEVFGDGNGRVWLQGSMTASNFLERVTPTTGSEG